MPARRPRASSTKTKWITIQCTGVAVRAESVINVAGGNPVIVVVMQINKQTRTQAAECQTERACQANEIQHLTSPEGRPETNRCKRWATLARTTLPINRHVASIVPEGCVGQNETSVGKTHDTMPTVARTIRTACITNRCTPSRRAQEIEVVSLLAAAG